MPTKKILQLDQILDEQMSSDVYVEVADENAGPTSYKASLAQIKTFVSANPDFSNTQLRGLTQTLTQGGVPRVTRQAWQTDASIPNDNVPATVARIQMDMGPLSATVKFRITGSLFAQVGGALVGMVEMAVELSLYRVAGAVATLGPSSDESAFLGTDPGAIALTLTPVAGAMDEQNTFDVQVAFDGDDSLVFVASAEVEIRGDCSNVLSVDFNP